MISFFFDFFQYITTSGKEFHQLGVSSVRSGDFLKGMELFKKAVSKNHVFSNHTMADLYSHGKHILYGDKRMADYEKAFYHYKISAKKYLHSKFKVAEMLVKGRGCQKNVRFGVKLLREILHKKRDNPTCEIYVNVIILLAKLHRKGNYKFKKDENESIKGFLRALNLKLKQSFYKSICNEYDDELCIKEELRCKRPFITAYYHSYHNLFVKKKNMIIPAYQKVLQNFIEMQKNKRMLKSLFRSIGHSYKMEKQYKKALNYYISAAQVGSIPALEYLGEIFSKNWAWNSSGNRKGDLGRIEKHRNISKIYYEKAREMKSNSVGYKLGYYFSINRDFTRALQNYHSVLNDHVIENEFTLIPVKVNNFPSSIFYKKKTKKTETAETVKNIMYERLLNVYLFKKKKSSRKTFSKCASLCGIGNLYFKNRIRSNNRMAKSRYFYYKAALLGRNKGLKLLGKSFLKKKRFRRRLTLSKKEYAKIGLKFLHRSLKDDSKGNIECSIGSAYLKLIKDYKRAFYFMKKSSKKNNRDGINMLGLMYDLGRGAPKDTKKATECFLRAAALKDTSSMFQLGVRAYYGWEEIKPNLEEAIKYFKMGSENNHVESTKKLSSIFLLQKQYEKAIFYFRVACKQESYVQKNWETLNEVIKSVAKIYLLRDISRLKKNMSFCDVVIFTNYEKTN